MNGRHGIRWIPYLVALIILAGACFIAGNVLTDRPSASAQAGPDIAPEASGSCTIEHIGVYDNRIHVRCKANSGGIGGTILYFARETTSNAGTADRMLALLMSAWAFERPAMIEWDTQAAHNPPGCQTGDCRRLLDLYVR